MRASVMLHLPMLTLLKQMGKVHQLAAKLGLTLRGIYGEGSEAQGNLYQLSNQVTLGRTEKEIADAVIAVLDPVRQRYDALIKNQGYLDEVLKAGAEAAQKTAWKTLSKVYRKGGFPERAR
jgi:protein-arginine kinase